MTWKEDGLMDELVVSCRVVSCLVVWSPKGGGRRGMNGYPQYDHKQRSKEKKTS